MGLLLDLWYYYGDHVLKEGITPTLTFGKHMIIVSENGHPFTSR